ncbi:MAG: pyridoxal phosphate-dependent aminotransferase family protein [Spirochaetia bacterium]|nr:pyridoxal phosphate-dependent aminotransferase family protein [Spirochaetota bacterium]MCX8096488.1 pyridoxal phosphate-dependent aminotransferase family protein [Spirochaetota bacterium]MDW8113164.1 pyridoxal phosphate-dependent aminotransferase family protein [Spirochaetia bacterium]
MSKHLETHLKNEELYKRITSYTEVDEAKAVGLYPYFRPIEETHTNEVYINGKKYLMLGSNAYLGLTNDPRVIEAAVEATRKFGTGNAGSRFLNGTLKIHEELEEKLAKFVNKEAALLTSTGYMANLVAIAGLLGPGDAVITDKLDHASIIDACKQSGAKMYRFAHNNIEHLKRVLEKVEEKAKLVVVDGVFSMEGDIADLPNIVEVCKKYNAWIMVDDAHGMGVLGGKYGQGTVHHFGLDDEVDIIMSTFSKSFASIGGFVAGSERLINYLKHKARALIFSASPSPATVGTVSKVIDIIYEEPYRIERLWQITHKMLKAFKEMGYDTGTSCTPIIPLKINNFEKTLKFWRALSDEGIFVNPVLPPAVPPSETIIRTSYMATHTDEQLDWALTIFEKHGKALGIVNSHAKVDSV